MPDELKEAYNDEYMFLTQILRELESTEPLAVQGVIQLIKDRKEDMFNRGL